MGHLKRLLLRGLCGGLRRSNFHKTTLVAAITLTIRPLMSADFSDKLMSIYLLNVLSIPALTLHLKQSSPDSLTMLQKNRIVARSVELLSQEQQLKIHFNALEGSYALCLTANLVHLVSQMTEEQFADVDLIKLLFVITRLMESCGQVSWVVFPNVESKSETSLERCVSSTSPRSSRTSATGIRCSGGFPLAWTRTSRIRWSE